MTMLNCFKDYNKQMVYEYLLRIKNTDNIVYGFGNSNKRNINQDEIENTDQ